MSNIWHFFHLISNFVINSFTLLGNNVAFVAHFFFNLYLVIVTFFSHQNSLWPLIIFFFCYNHNFLSLWPFLKLWPYQGYFCNNHYFLSLWPFFKLCLFYGYFSYNQDFFVTLAFHLYFGLFMATSVTIHIFVTFAIF